MMLTLVVLAVEIAALASVAWWLFRKSFYPERYR